MTTDAEQRTQNKTLFKYTTKWGEDETPVIKLNTIREQEQEDHIWAWENTREN